jgi:hypothetical protein
MRFRMLVVAATAAGLLFAHGAVAQTPATGTGATAAPAEKKKPARKKGTSSKKKGKKETPPPPPAPAAPAADIDEETRKALEGGTTTPAPAPAPAPTPVPEAPAAPADDTPPVLNHTPVTKATKGKPFTVTATASDPSGVFGPILYLRKKGMGVTEYIPIRMAASKTTPGEYSVEIPALLVSVDALEYYIEAWDNAGNGPTRAGAPDKPLAIPVEEEKKIIVAPPEAPPPTVTIKPKGAPPAITHTALTQATRGAPIELNARIGGDTGVQGATILFRHVGEKDYKALPMGNIGGDDYTATVPAGQATSDIEYYLEAFDKYGNGPGRSGAPTVPYRIKVLEAAAGEPLTSRGTTPAGPRVVRAPFKPNPGRSIGWLFMGGFLGGAVFAGGSALAASQANSAYTHTFEYEGRVRRDLLDRANDYGKRAAVASIVAGACLVTSIVLLLVFPEHPDTMVVGGGDGSMGVRF